MQWTVDAPGGQLPVIAEDDSSDIVVVLAHGAGSNMEHRTMQWLSGIVRRAGASVVRFNFHYRVLGKLMPDRMPVCVANYRAVIDSVREKLAPKRLIIGGHSFGGRVASMLEAEGKTADGLLLFSYPLHPPGQPQKLRDEHLGKIITPTLQMSGTEDEFCTKEIMDRIVTTLDPRIWRLHWIEGTDHSYTVKKSAGRTRNDVEQEMSAAVGSWLEG